MITIAVVGGGYAGLNTVKALYKQLAGAEKNAVRLVLIDKHPYHFRKVMLFKEAVDGAVLHIPFAEILEPGIEFLQASLVAVDPLTRKIRYDTPAGTGVLMYDKLVLALGSSIVETPPELGGISLHSVENARRVRQEMTACLRRAKETADAAQRKKLLSVAVVGGGITGMETAAELSHWLRKEARLARLDPSLVSVTLINAAKRLLPGKPEKFRSVIERTLTDVGVRIVNGTKAVRHADGRVELDNGQSLDAAVCVWTLGLRANPLIRTLGLPTDDKGRLVVDAQYRLHGDRNVYAIGDNAKIVDPDTGAEDEMTCKEAVAQATRLARVIKADLEGKSAPRHKSYIPLYCVGLGPERGVFWFRPWGKQLDVIFTGKLGLKLRHATWNIPSFYTGKVVKRLQAVDRRTERLTNVP